MEARQSNGTYTAVTREWLELGFARGLAVPDSEAGTANSVHPNAILVFQVLADRDGDGSLTASATSNYAAECGRHWRWSSQQLVSINLYDSREGELRAPTAGTQPAVSVAS